MTTVDAILVVPGLLIVVAAFALPLWAARRHDLTFPKDWDRTGWTPAPGRARRFETMWAYFSGGRGEG